MTPGFNPSGFDANGFNPGGVDTAGDTSNQVMAGVLDSLQQSRTLLLDPSPRNLDHCRLAVAQCVPKVSELFEGNRDGWNGELRDSLLLVRGELSAITGLLDAAAVFRRGILRAISDATPPSLVEVDPATDQKARRVHVLG